MRTGSRWTNHVISLCVLCVLCGESSASPPSLESVAPAVGQRGTEFTLTLTGARLNDPRELLFYSPGLTCSRITAESESKASATIKAAEDCPLGEHAFRLVTKSGTSELRIVRVTPLPVVREAVGDNDIPGRAQKVALNVTVAGTIESGDVDCYSVSLKKGDRLSAEVEAVRLGSPTLDAVLTISGPDGRVIVEVDDDPLFRQDPFVSLLAPADGVYIVSVRDTADGGGSGDHYALHLGSFLRPAAVYPAGGPIGVETKVALLGVPGGDVTQSVKPTSASWQFRPEDAGGAAPTPNPFRVSPFANVLEADKPTAVKWPIAFNGVIEQPGDTDDFLLTASKGDTLQVTAYAYRVGSPLDSVVSVFDSAGSLVAQGDDDETHDSRFLFTVPADGVYTVRVADKRRQGGPRFIYRIEVDQPKPALTVFLATASRKSQDGHVITVARGGRTAAFLAVRRAGVEGDVTLALPQLPEGVELSGKPFITAEEYFVPVVFTASATAPLSATLIEVNGNTKGKPSVSGSFSQSANLVVGPGDSALHTVTTSKLCIAVVEPAPYSVTLSAPTTTLSADGSLDLTVKVTRDTEFTDALEVTFPSLPPGVETPGSVVVAADKTEAVVTLTAQRGAEPGDWPFFVQVKPARAAVSRDPLAGGGTTGTRPRRARPAASPQASPLVNLTVTPSLITAKFKPVVVEQGRSVKVVCEFTSKEPLPVGFTATLTGLPPRAVAEPILLKSSDKQIEFAVNVDATTPTGMHNTLIGELSGEVNGQKVVYRVGRTGLFSVAPLGGVKTDAAGKPLTPLEALRKEEAEKKP
jgi:hypothetical protein